MTPNASHNSSVPAGKRWQLVVEYHDDRLVCGMTLVLAALATGIAELALAEIGQPAVVSLAVAAAIFALALAAHWWIGRRVHFQGAVRPIAIVGVVALFAAPFAIEALRLVGFGRVQPMELVLLAALRNLGLGLA